MAEVVAGIALPEGDPGAAADAAAGLRSAAGGFERTATVTRRAVSSVPTWQGVASFSFRDRCAGYEDASGAAQAACERVANALRRYGDRLEEARERVRKLQRRAEDCLDRIRAAEARAAAAGERAAFASEMAFQASFTSGADAGASVASYRQQADDARAELAAAEADAREASEELERLEGSAENERERVREAGRTAAAMVESAERTLPAVTRPAVAASAGDVPAGGRLKVPDPRESAVDRLFGRDYVYPEAAAGVVLEMGPGSGTARALGRVLGIGASKPGPPRVRLTPGGGLKAHEGAGRGHTIAKHVGLSDDALRARLSSAPRIPSASTFTDRAIAEDAVSGALTANRTRVEYFVKSENRSLVIEQEFDRAVGRTLTRVGLRQRMSARRASCWSKTSRRSVITSRLPSQSHE